MITNTNKKVICIKDIPSNLIEEAIFILKTDIDASNEKLKKKRKEIIENEAESLLNDYMDDVSDYDYEYENENETEKLNFRNKKIKAILITVSAVIVCYLLSLLFIRT